MATCALGIDFGTNSVRALIVDTADGRDVAMAVAAYPSGKDGILLDAKNHHVARQSPVDYAVTLEQVVLAAMRKALDAGSFSAADIVGIGVDTTGSTPIPVDAQGRPLCLQPRFKDNLNAYAWLWKDHTSFAEASRITEAARTLRPQYLAKCGGTYSSEWYWSKLWHCLNVDPELFAAAAAWLEMEDYIPALLCGITDPRAVPRGICAAGHKALYHASWGGYPDEEFLRSLDPRLASLRQFLPASALTLDHKVGCLCKEWALKLGLPEDVAVAVGAFDAHLGAVGAGVRPGTLVKIIGTSTCDVMVAPTSAPLPDIPGVCGIVDGSVLPGFYGIEAGQSAVGDIFRWFVNHVCEGDDALQIRLADQARTLKPGQSGLLALDWNNGNRTILVDPQLSGLMVGMTLHSTRAEMYRALIEGTAFGALTIINRIEEYGVPIERVVCCGGIAEKNDLFMQIYADVLNRPMFVSRSAQTCALGSAIAGALAAGVYRSGLEAVAAMTGVKAKVFHPIPENVAVYRRLYSLYRALHDAFGTDGNPSVRPVMKALLALKAEVV